MPKTPWPRLACASALAALTTLAAPSALAADPAPVMTGLWEVNLLTSYAAPSAGAAALPPQAPRRRTYRICIGPERAREPMQPPRTATQAELLFGRGTISGSYAMKGPGGQARPVEFAYHRLDATRFEGSHDVLQPDAMVRTQYMARRVAADCGGLAPQPVPDTGEP